MKKSHFNLISELLSDIRNTIKEHQENVDSEIKKYNRQVSTDTERLNQETLDFETRKNRLIAQSGVRNSAEQAIRSVDYTFDDIQKEVNQWAVEQPSAEFLSIMETVNRFNLELSVDEIKILSQSAAGSYFAEKVLSGFAEKSGLRYPFSTVEELNQMIRNARADCHVAINAYCGDLSGNKAEKWITDDIGQFQTHQRVLAAEFLTRDHSSLIDLEDALTTATDNTLSLIPNEQQRIAAMFDGILPEDRYDKMKSLILEFPKLETKLAVFDKECYQRAKDEIREQRESEYQASLLAVREASDRALKAKRAAVSTSMA